MRTAGVRLLQQRQSVPCVRALGAQVLRTEVSTSCAHLGRPWGKSVSPGSWLQWELSRSPSKGTLSLMLPCIASCITGCRDSARAPHPGSPVLRLLVTHLSATSCQGYWSPGNESRGQGGFLPTPPGSGSCPISQGWRQATSRQRAGQCGSTSRVYTVGARGGCGFLTEQHNSGVLQRS